MCGYISARAPRLTTLCHQTQRLKQKTLRNLGYAQANACPLCRGGEEADSTSARNDGRVRGTQLFGRAATLSQMRLGTLTDCCRERSAFRRAGLRGALAALADVVRDSNRQNGMRVWRTLTRTGGAIAIISQERHGQQDVIS